MQHTRSCDVADAPTIRPVDVEPLVGAWLNYDTTSVGPQRLRISRRSSALVIEAPGWSEVDGAAFAAGAAGDEAVGFLARTDHGLLAAYLNKRLLVVDFYTRGPVNHFRRDHFYRDHFSLG
jgi:hypothetical protein